MEEARRRAKSSRKQIETGGRFTAPEGRHEIRVLETPADKERKSPALYLEYLVHYKVGPNKRTARCGNEPGQTKHRRCWLCRKIAQLEQEGRTAKAAEMAPQQKLAVQVAVKDPDSGDMVGPLLWEMPVGKSADSIGYKIKGVISSDRRNYTDHKRGYNIHFRRIGQMLKTKYEDFEADDHHSKVPSGIVKQLKPFVDAGIYQYDEQWQKDAYYGRDEKGENTMAAKKKGKKVKDDDSDVSSSDVSSSDASSSDASGSDSSSSDASSSSSSSSVEVKVKHKKNKKGKKTKDDSDESSSDASSSDSSSSSSDASSSDSDSSSSDESASGSDSSSSDSSSSDESSSDASSSSSDASSSSSDASSSDADEKPKRGKRKPRSDKGKARKPKKTKRGKK
jgi:hypothetical protein